MLLFARIACLGSGRKGASWRRSDHRCFVFGSPRGGPLRANIDETAPPVIITEQGENRNQCEEQRNLFGSPHGFARRGT